MNYSDRIGVAVIGCGYWGGNYVRVFNEIEGCRTVAVCDRRPERLAAISQRFPNIYVTTDTAELLTQDGIDAVVVCTDATLHYEVARACLEKSKHLLIEKPLTTNVRDAMELAQYAHDQGCVLMVAHTFLYNAAIAKLKEYLGGAEDQVYYMHSRRTNLGPIRHDVSAVWDLATHDIAIFNHLLGQNPVWVSAVGANVLGNGHADVAFVALGYPRGVLGHIHVSWADPNKAREVVVVCSDKRILFNDLNGSEQIRVFQKGVRSVARHPSTFGEYQLEIRDGDIVSPKVEIREPLNSQCRHFADCVKNHTEPATSGWHGAQVVHVLMAVDQSMAMGGARVEVKTLEHDTKHTAVAVC